MVQVGGRADGFEEVAEEGFGRGGEICGLAGGVGLLGRAAKGFVGFPVQFLAVAAAVPLVLAFGAAFERVVRWGLVALCAGFLAGGHGREMGKAGRQETGERAGVRTVRC